MKLVLTAIGKKDLSFSNNLRASGLFLVNSEVRIPKNIMKVVNTVNVSVKDDLASRIKIERFSDYNLLLRVTARILKLYHTEPKATLKNATQEKNKYRCRDSGGILD